MDKTILPSDSSRSGQWTNEKHVNFLNSMEASFVRTMLENNTHFLPLDRYLPDSSESTLDLKTHRRKKKAATVDGNKGCPGAAGSNSRKRNLCQPHTSSQDQVVPQLGNRRDDTDQNGSSNVLVAPSNSERYLGF